MIAHIQNVFLMIDFLSFSFLPGRKRPRSQCVNSAPCVSEQYVSVALLRGLMDTGPGVCVLPRWVLAVRSTYICQLSEAADVCVRLFLKAATE